MKIRLANGSGVIELKYLYEDKDRYGNIRIYFRRKGLPKKIPIKQPIGSDEFLAEYRLAFSGKSPALLHTQESKRKTYPGSLRWLIEKYYQESESFSLLDSRTKHVRKLILDSICLEKVSDEDATLVGDLGFADMPPIAVRRLRDRKRKTPEAANQRIKALRQIFRFGVDSQYCTQNPAREVSYIRSATDGFHTWELQEVRRFEQTHAIGTKARLAFSILLYTGARRSDIINFGKQHVRNSENMSPLLREQHGGRWLHYTQHKNRNKKPVTLTLPILPELEEVLAASPLGDLTWLVTEFGKGFTAAGFGNWFREQCNKAGLHHCSAHGLRKAGATIAVENGASVHTLKAMFGWQTLKQAEHYTKAADQKRLAASGMRLIGRGKE